MLAQTVLPNENDVEIRVIQNGSEQLLTADLVVNASGSRLKEVLPQSLWDSLPPLKWVRAFNLVLRTQLHPTHAIALTAPQSSRLYFFVPRSSPIKGGATAVGTYYLPMPAGEHTERISESEVQNFLNEINATVQSSRYSLNDVLAIESGILPAKRVTQSAIELYGSEQILRQKRIVQVLSTKYTTYHSQAQKVLKALAQPM
jgi:glycerol-3-phosphate dehydrogenase